MKYYIRQEALVLLPTCPRVRLTVCFSLVFTQVVRMCSSFTHPYVICMGTNRWRLCSISQHMSARRGVAPTDIVVLSTTITLPRHASSADTAQHLLTVYMRLIKNMTTTRDTDAKVSHASSSSSSIHCYGQYEYISESLRP